MKIKFVQTGGFAGITKEAEIDTDLEPEESTSAIQKALDESQFFSLQSKDSAPRPDMEQFFITVEKEGQSHMVQLDTMNIPEKLKPLINDLKKRAKIKQF
ncbi:MAG: protealysin inhibitor emfourin [Candidatus Helarchaeota archaeon]